jgi:hypothetical protein
MTRIQTLISVTAILLTAAAAQVDDIPLVSDSVTQNADDRVEVFGTGGDGNLHHRWQLSVSGFACAQTYSLLPRHLPFLELLQDFE